MFNPLNPHSTVAQNKENAVQGSVVRAGKAGLLNVKNAGNAHPSKAFGSPLPSNTPSGKQPAGKAAQRTGLRNIISTPLAKPPLLQITNDQPPKTIKRRQGLFKGPQMQQLVIPSPELTLEPEYAPPRPSSPVLDAETLFGCEIDIGLIPKTQSSTYGAQMRELPPLDLDLEALLDIPSTPPKKWKKSAIPRPLLVPSPITIPCKPQLLIAESLNPTRIPKPKLKRKRLV
ncbi:hypothetical protein LPJ53_003857 [Coemansia erecta]|uniref:Securin n=1 Tax=Coemansia erecta TaxID=147472 RepID=A0A9W7XVF6_9FUNG|nr:hypothetical protein LPJ53_003857 [Coemansia erecta]